MSLFSNGRHRICFASMTWMEWRRRWSGRTCGCDMLRFSSVARSRSAFSAAAMGSAGHSRRAMGSAGSSRRAAAASACCRASLKAFAS